MPKLLQDHQLHFMITVHRMINEWMFLFLMFSVKVTYKHYHGSLSYKRHQYVILYELSTCYKEVFPTWLQLTTIILAVQRQWMLNFTTFCPSIHNSNTYFLCIFICLFIILIRFRRWVCIKNMSQYGPF